MNKKTLTIGLVQEKWVINPIEHQDNLAAGILSAAAQGAELVCLQELTLSPYFCTRSTAQSQVYMEDLSSGPTAKFVSQMAKKANVSITASLFENSGHNTAIAFNEQGKLIGVTRKQHIPSGEKYHEDHYFSAGDSNYPLHTLVNRKMGLPTCYDQWFPELSRIYGLKGAEVLIYPTAIGGEPTAPGFDTQPMWQKVIVAQGIMANCFMVAINRIGSEEGLEFYGSSFISSPFGEILAQASRTDAAVLVATLDFNQRELWERLFPFVSQRQPHTYHDLINANFSRTTDAH